MGKCSLCKKQDYDYGRGILKTRYIDGYLGSSVNLCYNCVYKLMRFLGYDENNDCECEKKRLDEMRFKDK